VSLLPGERQPLLPPIEDLSRYADPTAGSAPPTPGTDETLMQPPLQTKPLPPQQLPNSEPNGSAPPQPAPATPPPEETPKPQ
jgi:hypothetical protein